MNRYLLLNAAALMAVTTGANSALASTTVHLSGYCDYFIVAKNAGGWWAAKHWNAPACDSTVIYDTGHTYKSDGKKYVVFAESISTVNQNLMYDFSLPFRKGGTWSIIATTNGATTSVVNSGKQGAHVTPGVKKSSVSEAVAAFLALKSRK